MRCHSGSSMALAKRVMSRLRMRLLAEEVVDAEDGRLGEVRCSVALSSRADARSRPNGFSMIRRAPLLSPTSASPPATHSNIDGGMARWKTGCCAVAHRLLDLLEGLRVGVVARDEAHVLEQLVERLLVPLLAGVLERRPRTWSARSSWVQSSGHADDRDVEQPALVQPVDRGEQLLLGQVARDAEHHQAVGPGRSADGGRRHHGGPRWGVRPATVTRLDPTGGAQQRSC